MSVRTYRTEFPDFGELDVVIPAGFEDTSWHNDACPSFTKTFMDTDGFVSMYLRIWVDYKDSDKRQTPKGSSRFVLEVLSADYEHIECSEASDDWRDIVEALRNS